MTLATKIDLSVIAALSNALDLASADSTLNLSQQYRLATGTGADKADRLWHDTRTLAASATEDLDLAGTALLDPLNTTAVFARVKGLLVVADRLNVNNVLVGGAASNAFINWVSDATDKVVVRPGGALLLVAPDATGYAVTATTGDLLRIGNSGAGSSVTYKIVIVGASA